MNEQKSDEGMSDERMSKFPALPVTFAAKYGAQEGQHTFYNLACYCTLALVAMLTLCVASPTMLLTMRSQPSIKVRGGGGDKAIFFW